MYGKDVMILQYILIILLLLARTNACISNPSFELYYHESYFGPQSGGWGTVTIFSGSNGYSVSFSSPDKIPMRIVELVDISDPMECYQYAKDNGHTHMGWAEPYWLNRFSMYNGDSVGVRCIMTDRWGFENFSQPTTTQELLQFAPGRVYEVLPDPKLLWGDGGCWGEPVGMALSELYEPQTTDLRRAPFVFDSDHMFNEEIQPVNDPYGLPAEQRCMMSAMPSVDYDYYGLNELDECKTGRDSVYYNNLEEIPGCVVSDPTKWRRVWHVYKNPACKNSCRPSNTALEPCFGNGHCLAGGSCLCGLFHRGQFCDLLNYDCRKQTDPWVSIDPYHPCGPHGGTCFQCRDQPLHPDCQGQPTSFYTCDCPQGWMGDHCEINTNMCIKP